MNDKILSGKVGLIFGVASHRSIAAGIATSLASQGADLVLNYQNDRVHNNVRRLDQEVRSKIGIKVRLLPCDDTDHQQMSVLGTSVREHFDQVDFLLHSLAYAPREALDKDFTNTSRADFNTALDI